MSAGETDQVIEQIKADLRESQFKAWDVETFLANRHQAKIDALREPKTRKRKFWVEANECADLVFIVLGKAAAAIFIGHWLLTGNPMP